MLKFSKWEGTGNDFILIDDRSPSSLPVAGSGEADPAELSRMLCDRHFGIGGDGLILIQQRDGVDYHMEFFNPDGSRSFCGNGSRCAFAFWSATTGPAGPQGAARFSAIDGTHTAERRGGSIAIGMREVNGVEQIADGVDLIHTGSPHLLVWTDDPEAIDLLPEARKWRHGDRFKREGVNVNFLAWNGDHLAVRTYERGVEDETLSCGTGVTAAALAAMHRGLVSGRCEVRMRGGVLWVEAAAGNGAFTNIVLIGPVRHVFDGEVDPEKTGWK